MSSSSSCTATDLSAWVRPTTTRRRWLPTCTLSLRHSWLGRMRPAFPRSTNRSRAMSVTRAAEWRRGPDPQSTSPCGTSQESGPVSIELYNTCAGTQYMRRNGQATRNYGRGVDGRWEDLDRFMTDAGELAEELLSEGIRGMKIWPFDAYAEMSNGMHLSAEQMHAGLEPIRKIRAAVGDQMNVMIELHGLWSPATASSIIRSLQPYAPYWVEDPVRTDLIGALAEVHATASTTGTLIAVGETVAGGTGFMPLLSQPSVDVVTLDLSWCGGITHATRIAALAELHGRAIAPHDCTGPVALTAATHLSVAAPNALVQETVRATMRTWYQDFVTVLPLITEGKIRPPEGPGLGTELQPDVRAREGVRVRESVMPSL